MARVHIDYKSPILGRSTSCTVLMPQEIDGPLPLVCQLHGRSDDHSSWSRRSSLERYAEERGLIILCPDGEFGWYCNWPDGRGDYEDHILATIDFIEGLLPCIGSRAGRAIGGLSMGGYGAVKLGLKHPDRFCSVVAHSAAIDPAARIVEKCWAERSLLCGGKLADTDDAFALAARAMAGGAPLPALHIDCGQEDFLIEDNRRFHAHLQALGLDHAYHEHPGAHDWAYWDRHCCAGLDAHLAAFAAARP